MTSENSAGAEPPAYGSSGHVRHRGDAGQVPRGIHVPLVTPFDADGSRVDVEALEQLAFAMADAGAAGLVALGTTAESASLDAAERRAVVGVCARVARERGIGLTVGLGTNDTRKAAEELAALPDLVAAGTGAGGRPGSGGGGTVAALVPVPYFTRPTEAGVVAHFAHLAAGSPVPLVVYHVPYRTGRALSSATLRALAAIPGVAGIKHSPGGIDQDTVELLAAPELDARSGASGASGAAGSGGSGGGSGFRVFAGDDTVCSPLLALGAAGGILASAHVATGVFVELTAAWRRGDVARGRELGHRLVGLSAALFAEPNPVVIKGVLHALGRIPSAAVRLPLLPASAGAVERALAELAAVEAADAAPVREDAPAVC
ncbi:dihydrodipicolinate synthase family protein [Yinghuangia soli]|uniref:Dihydrodipicolinate synthase family protein n=1 Tax=Yinghuangia soli TaxID=2908204 RepID=A0AA41Q3P4_9ACTN|nr:dihydrodipicolinate synthase family protein [Yinghuangia soli]MCF2530741.1 dihydrodipicolinate synthase family protein [Yinghuangia soli]